MKKNKYTSKQRITIKKYRALSIRFFIGALLLGFIIGLLIFLRPSISNVEKRTLNQFPKFTAASFLDGSFFSDISLWYSDTYPMRDSLIALDRDIKATYGITSKTQLIGGHSTSDEIPTLTADNTADSDLVSMTPTSTDSSETVKTVNAPDSKEMDLAIQNKIQAGLYVKNGAAYSIYYYLQNSADGYIKALNSAAAKLQGIANVYSILLPNNSGALLSEKELQELGGSDQGQAISYYYSQFQNVKTIETYNTLREHNDEYLYFRTDHHWTSLGAYYIYRNFCESKGWTPHELSEFTSMRFSPFLGTFYDTLADPDMAANPDYVDAYIPMGTNDMTYWDADNSEINWSIITDVSDWGINSGYYCFIGGDKPLSIINNPQIQDGSSCLVLKESYANCFIPYLVDHYQTVYIIDFRYSKVNVVDYVKQNQIQDLIIMNNITIAGDESVVSTISGLL